MPMGISLYSYLESADIISHLRYSARSRANDVFPLPVGPVIIINVFWFNVDRCFVR